MLRAYILRRILHLVPVIVFVAALNFLVINLSPGDPAVLLSGEMGGGDPAVIEAIRQKYGLNKPLPERFILYFRALARGDLGHSYLYNRSVTSVLFDRLPNTLILVLLGIGLAVVGGTLLGVYAAMRHGGTVDVALSMSSVVFYSIPVFWLGMMLVLLFGIRLGWLPTSGVMSVTDNYTGWRHIADRMRHLILPVATLTLGSVAQYLRLARASVVEVMREDFITTVRTIGFSEKRVFFKYALPNALLPVVTVVGLQLGFVFGGAVLVETVFGWPGLGREIFQAVSSRDYPVIMGGYLLSAIGVALATLLTDIAYAYLDPRVVYR
jgi:peptide/nickel transport system permease protein